MTAFQTIRLITKRELRERGATRGFYIGTAITIIIVVAGIVLPSVLGGDGPDERQLGVVGEAPAELGSQLEAVLPEDAEVAVTELADRDTAVTALEEGELDAVLVDRSELLADGSGDDELRAALDGVLQLDAVGQRLDELGVDPAAAGQVLAPAAPLELVDIGADDAEGTDPGDGGFLIAIGLTILLFLGIQMNGASVMTGALEEKSSRVVEVLVSVARPWQLLAGKLLGMSILAIVQIGLVVAAALIANAFADTFELPAATGTLVATSMLMLVAGFLFYASLYAVAGTLASSLEDAQSSAGPLGFLLTGAYFAVFFVVLPSPDSIWSEVLSYVPATAPFTVPARLGLGEMTTVEALISVVVTLVTAFVTVRLAGRLYASSLLAGGKQSWRDAWRGEPVR